MLDPCPGFCTHALLWIVPAKVDGVWQLEDGELVLEQQFQMVSGRITRSGRTAAIEDGRLSGNVLTFLAAGATVPRAGRPGQRGEDAGRGPARRRRRAVAGGADSVRCGNGPALSLCRSTRSDRQSVAQPVNSLRRPRPCGGRCLRAACRSRG